MLQNPNDPAPPDPLLADGRGLVPPQLPFPPLPSLPIPFPSLSPLRSRIPKIQLGGLRERCEIPLPPSVHSPTRPDSVHSDFGAL